MNPKNDELLQIIDIATAPSKEITKGEILVIAKGLRVREINQLIYDLEKQGKNLKRQAFDIFTTIGILSDEVRRRAESLDQNQPT